VSIESIKILRDRTGAGMSDCKAALTANGGDIEKAIDWLRAKGIAKAAKKASRAATEGLVDYYIHGTGRIGVLIEVNCETDFVAMTDNFKGLVRDIAMHIAAASPEYVSVEDIPADARDREKRVQLERVMAEGKPEKIAEKIVEGRMSKWYEEVCLLEQKFIKDDSKSIKDLITEAVATIGENIKVRRFSRFALGEGLEKKETDFAAEVAAMTGA
jgi:elongation factor Ts